MSDYKEVETQICIDNEDILREVLSIIVGECHAGEEVDTTISENTSVTNVFNHSHQVRFAIRKEQLPEHLQEYGDLGIVERNGKFTFLAIRPDESHYMDRRKGWEVGTFAAASESFVQEIEDAYGCLSRARDMVARTPGLKIAGPLHAVQDEDGSSAWGIAFECPESIVKRVVNR